MSYRSHVAAPSRVFDHLYDPIFTTSDQKNVYKENCVALTRSAPIHVYPVYDSMFTELNYEERNCYAYQRNTLPFIASTKQQQQQERNISVTGVDRPKFFSNPISNIRTMNIGLMADKNAIESHDESQVKYKTTAMQTVYRESSAQTRAWLPECFTEEIIDDVPEVVYIADMIDSVTYPGLREIEIIERARKRRSWEMSLPPIKQADEIPSRVAALEAFEWEEWIAREKEINECQQARLKIVADLIAKREEKHKMSSNQKVENCKRRALEERNKQKEILIRNYQRNMRKLDLAQRKDQMRNKKDDPVVAHYDKKTEYSFPKIRLDAISKKRTQIEYSNELESRFTSLEQDNAVSEDVQRYLKPNKRELWLPKEQTKEIERGIWNENYLKRLHETLKNFRRKKYPKRRLPAKCVSYESPNISIEKTTPTFPSSLFDDHLDKDYQDNVLIQKTVKGRAIQSMLLRGMKKFHDVIEEAKETHSIAAVRKLFPKEFSQQIDNQEQILNEYKRIEEALKNDKKLQEELKKVESKDAGNLLNFLEKEFNRLQGEKRAHAMYLLAERERYRREAETLGKKDFDDQFKNDAITLYLENILLDGINRAVDDDSREYIRKVARKLDKKASKTVTFHEAIEEFSNESNTEDVSDVYEIPDENVVVELLKDNMVPQIMDRIKNEQKIAHQKKLLMQAHIDLYFDEFEQIKFEEKQEICSSILDEIIQNATYEEEIEEISEFKPSRQNSAEAEALASQIVEQILNEIMENENFDISVSVTESSTSRDYDGDDSNVQSTSETESSTDYLAKEIVVGVLNDIIESGIVSTSEYTEETSDSY